MDGAEMLNRDAMVPADSSPALSSWRIWRRVGSARALKIRAALFMVNSLAILLKMSSPGGASV